MAKDTGQIDQGLQGTLGAKSQAEVQPTAAAGGGFQPSGSGAFATSADDQPGVTINGMRYQVSRAQNQETGAYEPGGASALYNDPQTGQEMVVKVDDSGNLIPSSAKPASIAPGDPNFAKMIAIGGAGLGAGSLLGLGAGAGSTLASTGMGGDTAAMYGFGDSALGAGAGAGGADVLTAADLAQGAAMTGAEAAGGVAPVITDPATGLAVGAAGAPAIGAEGAPEIAAPAIPSVPGTPPATTAPITPPTPTPVSTTTPAISGAQVGVSGAPGAPAGVADIPGVPPPTPGATEEEMLAKARAAQAASAAGGAAADTGMVQKALQSLGLYDATKGALGPNVLPLAMTAGSQLLANRGQKSQQAQLEKIAAPASAASKTLLEQGMAGQAPQNIVNQANTTYEHTVDAIRQRYANMGRDPNNDSAAAAEIATAAQARDDSISKYAQGLIGQGLSAAGVAAGPATAAVNAGAAQDTALQSSMSDTLKTLAMMQALKAGQPAPAG